MHVFVQREICFKQMNSKFYVNFDELMSQVKLTCVFEGNAQLTLVM